MSGLQVNLDGDDVILAWSAAAGVRYSVWSSGSLSGDDWSLTSGVESRDDAGTASIRDAGAAESGRRRFYRVEAAFD